MNPNFCGPALKMTSMIWKRRRKTLKGTSPSCDSDVLSTMKRSSSPALHTRVGGNFSMGMYSASPRRRTKRMKEPSPRTRCAAATPPSLAGQGVAADEHTRTAGGVLIDVDGPLVRQYGCQDMAIWWLDAWALGTLARNRGCCGMVGTQKRLRSTNTDVWSAHTISDPWAGGGGRMKERAAGKSPLGATTPPPTCAHMKDACAKSGGNDMSEGLCASSVDRILWAKWRPQCQYGGRHMQSPIAATCVSILARLNSMALTLVGRSRWPSWQAQSPKSGVRTDPAAHETRHMCISDDERGPHLGISRGRRPLPIEAGAAIPDRMESDNQGWASAAHPQTSTSPMPLGVAHDALPPFGLLTLAGRTGRPKQEGYAMRNPKGIPVRPTRRTSQSCAFAQSVILPVWTQNKKALG